MMAYSVRQPCHQRWTIEQILFSEISLKDDNLAFSWLFFVFIMPETMKDKKVKARR